MRVLKCSLPGCEYDPKKPEDLLNHYKTHTIDELSSYLYDLLVTDFGTRIEHDIQVKTALYRLSNSRLPDEIDFKKLSADELDTLATIVISAVQSVENFKNRVAARLKQHGIKDVRFE